MVNYHTTGSFLTFHHVTHDILALFYFSFTCSFYEATHSNEKVCSFACYRGINPKYLSDWYYHGQAKKVPHPLISNIVLFCLRQDKQRDLLSNVLEQRPSNRWHIMDNQNGNLFKDDYWNDFGEYSYIIMGCCVVYRSKVCVFINLNNYPLWRMQSIVTRRIRSTWFLSSSYWS